MNYQLLHGDNRQVLRTLPAKSVHAIVTSPPYFNLRAYSGDQALDWEAMEYSPMPGLPPISIAAWRGSLGNEPTLEAFIGHLVLCLREWHRVLRDDGCCFVNLGDSYNGSGGAGGDYNAGGIREGQPKAKGSKVGTLKNKDLCMVPARFALAAQADGWYLRQDIIWAKAESGDDREGNAMPNSVTDRCQTSHEYVFLLAKCPQYFFDSEAIKEPARDWGTRDRSKFRNGTTDGKLKHHGLDKSYKMGLRRSVWRINPRPFSAKSLGFTDIDHFATMPADLAGICIKAGSSEHGVCSACGSPWRRVVERTDQPDTSAKGSYFDKGKTGIDGNGRVQAGERYIKQATGFAPTCTCNLEGINYAADDMEIIETPTGERVADDPTMQTGRKGLNRPRGENEGRRPITRYEQRQYAMQLRNSDYREHMEHEAGSAFAHYIRIDASGARPVPGDMLDSWIARGWIERVAVPTFTPYPVAPSVVLDPFGGSGTTAATAVALGRNAISIDLSAEYMALQEARIREAINASGRAYVAPTCKAADFADMPLFSEVTA